MSNGKRCGRKDGHPGWHRSPEAVEADRKRHRDWIAAYRMTAKGILADVVKGSRERESPDG